MRKIIKEAVKVNAKVGQWKNNKTKSNYVVNKTNNQKKN